MTGPNIRVITAPACEPVSRAEAETWSRVAADEDAALVNMLIQAARERAEEITGRAFVRRELEVVYDAFPEAAAPIELPGAPLISVQYIRYIDTAGAEQTLEGSPESWILDVVTQPGRIQPLIGSDWPATQAGRIGAVKIGFTCGYSFTGSPSDDAQRAAIPAAARNWMFARIASFYENRESLVVRGEFHQPPRDFVDGLLDGLIVRKRFA